jgi:predicted AAA+ superfamily ATPase
MICQVAYLNRALRKDWLLSSYRTDGGAEVDLVIETAKSVIGVEVKAGRGVRPPDCRGLQSLAETVGKYKKVEPYIVYRGSERQALGDVKVVPWFPFLRHLAGVA